MFFLKKRGSSALAYGLIVGLISVVALVSVTEVGSSNKALMDNVATTLTGAVPSPVAGSSPSASPSIMASCLDILNNGASTGDGDYTIDRGSGNETVFCDMSGGGYTWPLDTASSHSQIALYLPAESSENPSISNVAGSASVATNSASYTASSSFFGSDSLFISGYLDITGLPALTGDFTIEMRVRMQGGTMGNMCAPYFAFDVVGATGGLILFNCDHTNSNVGAGMYMGESGWSNSSEASTGSVMADTWRHLAVSRESGTLRLFVDGALRDSSTYTTTISGSPMRIFARVDNLSYDMNGHIEEFRITNGNARYTSSFTPPTEPFRFQ